MVGSYFVEGRKNQLSCRYVNKALHDPNDDFYSLYKKMKPASQALGYPTLVLYVMKYCNLS